MTIRRELFATAAKLASLAMAALFTGCAVAPYAAAPRVQEADAQMVTSCKYVGYVQGSNGWGNLVPSAAMKYAKRQAKEYAASLGATDVVWDSVPQVHDAGYPWPAAPYLVLGENVPYLSGKAYKCLPDNSLKRTADRKLRNDRNVAAAVA